MTFYEWFTAQCVAHNTTPSAVAVAVGVSPAAANGWKGGSMPKSVTLMRIENYFGEKYSTPSTSDTLQIQGLSMGTLYENIKFLCDQKGIKAAQMCREVGIGPNTMTELKMGRVKSLSAPKLEKIAEYFGVSVSYLLGKEDVSRDTLQTLKDEEKVLLHSYRALTDEQKCMMSVFIKSLKDMQSYLSGG